MKTSYILPAVVCLPIFTFAGYIACLVLPLIVNTVVPIVVRVVAGS